MANNETSIIISAVDKTQGALNSVNGNLSTLEGQFTKLTGVVSGFAALAGVTAFAGIVKGAVDSAAGLHDMAQQTGASVESLSAMRAAAKLAGVDMEQVAGGLGKLSKNMLAASQGSGDAAKVFSALGISVTDSSGKMKTSDAVFLEFSRSLQTVGSASERAAAAQLVLGKSGAQLLPMMNDLGVAGELQAKITAKQAAAADDLQDNMTRLSTVGQAWKTTVAMEMVPAANAFVEALLEVSTTTDMSKKAAKDLAADGSIKEWAINSARAVGFVVDAFDGAARTVKGIGILIAAAAAQTAMVAKGDFAGAMTVDWRKDLSDLAGQEQFSDILARKLANIGTEAPKAAEGTRSLADALGRMSAEGGKASNALENLRIAEMMRVHKEAAKELEALTKQQDDYAKALQAALGPLETQAQNIEREVANYGLAESAIQGIIVARMEEARAMAALNGAWPEHLNYLDQEIAARKRIASASSQKEFLDANKKAAQQSAKDWEKFSDDINRALTDALMRGFEDGKSFGQNFVDSLKNSLKTAALKIVVNYVTSTGGSLIATGANAVLGTSFGAGGGGSSGGSSGSNGTNYLSLASNASTLYNGYNTAMVAGQWLGGSMSTANAAGTLYANATGTGLDGLLATNGAYGTAASGSTAGGASGGSAAGAGVSTIAWVAAIVAGMYMSSQAWKAGIRWENYAKEPQSKYDLEVYLRAQKDKPMEALFGKDFVNSEFYAVMSGSALSAQIHYMLQGALFGKTRVTGSEIRGTFSESAQGFSGEQGVSYKKTGGLFSKSKEWTEWNSLPAEVDTAMDGIYRSVRGSFMLLGEVFEDTTLAAKLKGFVHSFSVGTLDGEGIANELSANMSSVLTPAINAAAKSGEAWSSTFARVLEEANAVRRAMELMGNDLVQVFGKNNLNGILKGTNALVQLFGSVEKFNTSFNAYYGNFYSQSDQIKQAWRDMAGSFTSIGQVMPTTRKGFRELVDSLDLSTESGRGTFAALMSIQSAFAQLTPTIEQADQALKDTLQSQINYSQSLIDGFDNTRAALASYRTGLLTGDITTLSTTAKYAESKQVYQETASKAKLGDLGAASQLAAVSDAFLKISKDMGTSDAYAADFRSVVGTVNSVIGVADRQIPIAQSALNVAKAQLDALNNIATALGATSVPAFAVGGYHAGGLRLVGENGPELEMTGPSRIFTAAQTRAMMAGETNTELLAELKGLRQQVADQSYELRAIATSNAKLERMASRADTEGVVVRTDADTPLLTVAA
jgi:hypothetical protein